MVFFRNFFVALILCGILTRMASYFFRKSFKTVPCAYLSFFSVFVVILPIISFLVGFDIVIAEYVASLLIWLFYDLLRAVSMGKKKRKK